MSLVIVEAQTASAGSLFNLEIRWHVAASHVSLPGLKIEAREEIFPLDHPFRISRGSRSETRVVVVTVTDGQHTGRGEAVPIARYNQTPASVIAQIESFKTEKDLDRHRIQELLPAGAAELEARSLIPAHAVVLAGAWGSRPRLPSGAWGIPDLARQAGSTWIMPNHKDDL